MLSRLSSSPIPSSGCGNCSRASRPTPNSAHQPGHRRAQARHAGFHQGGAGSASLGSLAAYPATAGDLKLRTAFTDWLQRRYGLALDPATQVLPVNGSREALFALRADGDRPTVSPQPVVMSPNPFYQIYEGAALLAGRRAVLRASVPARNFAVDWDSVPRGRLGPHAAGVRLLAGQPHRRRHAAGRMEEAVRLSGPPRLRDRGRRVLQRDLLPRRAAAGRPGSRGQAGPARLQEPDVLHQLSKRSNVPGLRSGFVAGDAASSRSSCSTAPTTAAP
jgi:N-succinyldiaminopimelate aminotransferase